MAFPQDKKDYGKGIWDSLNSDRSIHKYGVDAVGLLLGESKYYGTSPGQVLNPDDLTIPENKRKHITQFLKEWPQAFSTRPRTAISWTAHRHVFLVVAQNDSCTYVKMGKFLTEDYSYQGEYSLLGYIRRKMKYNMEDMDTGIMLDGGGSSTLAFWDRKFDPGSSHTLIPQSDPNRPLKTIITVKWPK